MQRIDSFLSQIQDGTWHNLKKLAESSKTQKRKLKKLAQLLEKPGIVEYLPGKGQIKIREKWRRLLKNTSEVNRGRKAAVGTIVLRPQGTIRVQGVQMTNLLDTDIEINVKVNKKLEEISLGVVEKD